MREMTRKLYSQYEEKLQEEQQRHNAEKEALLVCMSPLLTEQPGGVGRIIVGELYMGRCVLGGELVDSNMGLVGAHSLLSLPPPFLYSPSSLLKRDLSLCLSVHLFLQPI